MVARGRVPFVLATIALALLAPSAGASILVDQANVGPFNNAFSFFTREANPAAEIGQTITVRQSGQLVGVDVPIYRDFLFDGDTNIGLFDSGVMVFVRDANFNLLGSVTLDSAQIPIVPFPDTDQLTLHIDLSSLNLSFATGDIFALTAVSTATVPLGIGGNGLDWLGATSPDSYAGGTTILRFGSDPFTSLFGPSADLGFRTFVDVTEVPEPFTLALFAGGAFGIVVMRRSRKIRPKI